MLPGSLIRGGFLPMAINLAIAMSIGLALRWTAEKMLNCIWVRPELVARFDFLAWTDSNHVRHIKFIAMRDDKDPRKVVREG
jgi:hypothetical protein